MVRAWSLSLTVERGELCNLEYVGNLSSDGQKFFGVCSTACVGLCKVCVPGGKGVNYSWGEAASMTSSSRVRSRCKRGTTIRLHRRVLRVAGVQYFVNEIRLLLS